MSEQTAPVEAPTETPQETQQELNLSAPSQTDSESPKQEDVNLSAQNPEESGVAWLKDLPEELRSVKTLQKFKSQEDLAKSYVELEKTFRNRNVQKMPDENSTDEERAAWRKHIGVPDTVEDYEVPQVIQNMTEDDVKMIFGEEGFNPILEDLHTLNLNQDNLNGVVNVFSKILDKMGAAQQEDDKQAKTNEVKNTVKELQLEWGLNYESNLAQYQDFVAQIKGFGEALQDLEGQNHLGVIKSLYNFRNELFNEDPMIGAKTSTHGMSKEERLKDLETRKNNQEITSDEYARLYNKVFEDEFR